MCGRGVMLVAVACAAGFEAGAALAVDVLRTRTIDAGSPYASDAVLYYDFAVATAASGVVKDASGSDYDGVCEGCTWESEGRFAGGAMAFSGNASAIVAYRAPDFTAWDRYSASLWFLHDGGGDHGPQYGHKMLDRTTVDHDWHLGLRPEDARGEEGVVGLFLYEGGRRTSLTDASRSWCDGGWHHVAVVRDGAHGELWIDGVRRAETEDMFGVRGAGPLCVGNSRSADRHQRKGWSGLLDEIRIFDRPLTPAEIVRLAERGVVAAETGQVSFGADVEVRGGLTVAGPARFDEGIRYVRPMGDLPMGVHTKGTVAHE